MLEGELRELQYQLVVVRRAGGSNAALEREYRAAERELTQVIAHQIAAELTGQDDQHGHP